MFMFSSCLDEFQKLNTNPEEFGTADPAAVFHGATKNYNNCSRAHLTGMYSGSMRLMQYLVSSGGASSGIYNNLENKKLGTLVHLLWNGYFKTWQIKTIAPKPYMMYTTY